MYILKSSVKSYFTFHYGLGCAIGLILFCGYILLLRKSKRDQGTSISWKEILWGLLLSIYLVIILGGTILNRAIDKEFDMELIPFWSYFEVIVKKNMALVSQMIGNVLAFIPFGVLLPKVWERMRNIRWVILSAVCVSLTLELSQLIFRLGLFEFDDVFHNTLGTVLGYVMWRIVTRKSLLRERRCIVD